MDLTKFIETVVLSKPEPANVASIHLKHPKTGEYLYGDNGKPVILTVHTKESQAFKDAVARLQRRVSESAASFKSLSLKLCPKYDAETRKNEVARMLAELSIGISNANYQGAEIDEAVFYDIYYDERFEWLSEQADALIAGSR